MACSQCSRKLQNSRLQNWKLQAQTTTAALFSRRLPVRHAGNANFLPAGAIHGGAEATTGCHPTLPSSPHLPPPPPCSLPRAHSSRRLIAAWASDRGNYFPVMSAGALQLLLARLEVRPGLRFSNGAVQMAAMRFCVCASVLVEGRLQTEGC